MRKIWSGKNNRLDVFVSQDIFNVLECTRRTIVILRIRGNGFVAIPAPQIANRIHLHLMAGRDLGDNLVQFAASATDADMAESNAIIRAKNLAVRESTVRQR